MYFDQLKNGVEIDWVSLNGAQFEHVFTIYSSFFKKFKHKIFNLKFELWDQRKRLVFYPNFTPRFPLYWQRSGKFKSCAKYLLSPEERVDVELIKNLLFSISSQKLLSVPLAKDSHVLFLGKVLHLFSLFDFYNVVN